MDSVFLTQRHKQWTFSRDARYLLSQYNIRLHKIIPNDKDVLSSFPLTEIDIDVDTVELTNSTQKTLGVSWRVSTDDLVIKCEIPHKEFTKRGLFSTINSTYDPLGMVAPSILGGKLLQRKMLPPMADLSPELTCGLDDPLPESSSRVGTLDDIPKLFH